MGIRTESGTMSGSDLGGEHIRHRGRGYVRMERKEKQRNMCQEKRLRRQIASRL